MSDYSLDQQRVFKSFNRAASGYDQVAILQQEVGSRLLERLDFLRLQPSVVLDAGAGTGDCCFDLKKRYPKAQVIGLDIAQNMLLTAKQKQPLWRKPIWLNADIEHLPMPDNSVDLIFSSLAIQWCEDLNPIFKEFKRVLKPNGALLFSSFGPRTLQELSECWASVDDRTHTNKFIDIRDVGDTLVTAEFSDVVMDSDVLRLCYSDVYALMRELKAMGAHNATAGRARGLTPPAHMRQMIAAYEQRRTEEGIVASFEAIYGLAWNLDRSTASCAIPSMPRPKLI